MKALRVLVALLVSCIASQAWAGGGTSQHWGGWSRRQWQPRDLNAEVLELRADRDVTLGTTPRAAGTTPPVLTWSGVLTPAQELCVQIDLLGARGTSTFKWSEDGCSTFKATGIVTAATNDLATTQGTVTLAWPVGTYATDNVYRATVASVVDQTNLGNTAAEATASRQLLYRATGFNGRPAFDWGTGGSSRGLSVTSLTLGAHTIFILGRGDANAEYAAVHITDASTNGSYTYCFAGFSTLIARGSVVSSFNVTGANAWFSDGTRRSVAIAFDGTHAGHILYRDAVAVTPTGGSGSDPGTGTVAGGFFIGRSGTLASVFRGVQTTVRVFSRALTAAEVARVHAYDTTLNPL